MAKGGAAALYPASSKSSVTAKITAKLTTAR
jgi:hypothetical protein